MTVRLTLFPRTEIMYVQQKGTATHTFPLPIPGIPVRRKVEGLRKLLLAIFLVQRLRPVKDQVADPAHPTKEFTEIIKE